MLFAKQAATDSEAAAWLPPSPTVGEQYMYNEAHVIHVPTCTCTLHTCNCIPLRLQWIQILAKFEASGFSKY